jgi:transcriptional regulator with PAS, ATPase and Fis domain
MAAVMLVGESGRGRKWRWSCCAHARAGKPFVSVNCGAIPANLVEAVSGY